MYGVAPPLALFLLLAALIAPAGDIVASAQRADGPSDHPAVVDVTWREVEPILRRLEHTAPLSLREIPAAQRPTQWPGWMADRKRVLSDRVRQGDVDSVVHLLLFGTSFTNVPRLTVARIADLSDRWANGDASAQAILTREYRQRASDLVSAAARPEPSVRMQDVREILAREGFPLRMPNQRDRARDFLLQNVVRVRQEAAALAADLERLRSRDAAEALAERSRIFRDRGLASDSSVLTQYAVERALCALADRGVAARDSVRRVAVVGPGLDFSDKQEGVDLYDPQTLQPFTLIDSLAECGLGEPGSVTVTTIDLSARVNRHLRSAVARAAAGQNYRIVLPWNTNAAANPEALAYWERAGGHVGASASAGAPRGKPGVRVRAVDVAAAVARRVQPITANIVYDRVRPVGQELFDMVVATNLLVYYDTFEQSLAAASIGAMLREGGVFLTNDAVLESPEIPLRSRGQLPVSFSEAGGDGERLVWYVKSARPEGP
jgi:hypothetical protein